MMLFRTIHLVFYPLYVIENRALVNDGKSRKKVRDTWPHLCFRKKLQYSILSDRKLGKNAKASTYTNLCVFIRFPDLTPLLAWIANMKSGKKCTCVLSMGRVAQKSNSLCFGVLKWKPLSVKKAHWNSTMFLNVWHLVKGLTPTGCLRGRCAALLVCHVKSNAWYPIKWQIDKNSH